MNENYLKNYRETIQTAKIKFHEISDIDDSGLDISGLIHFIQMKEGTVPCFQRQLPDIDIKVSMFEKKDCIHTGCCWRKFCNVK